ncbi:MAG: aminotransferase class I/II-fold pyridoxal phosphate-dependent enzyme [Saprospiraceae bacterium]|nr:aminotransferase class I/II-fold pyridoxal phosphate-dependent enzyme [Saprospiraceae bacterium]
MTDKLKELFDPSQFKDLGYKLVDILTDYFKNMNEGNAPVNNWEEPYEQLKFWKNYKNDSSPIKLFEDIISRSINIHHPGYMGHQVTAPAPITGLSSMLGAVLNNGMAIYEMGPSSTAIEKVVIDELLSKVGFSSKGDGFMTSGGTLANLTALLSARRAMSDNDIWEEGYHENLGIMVSSEAHYCVDRAARIMGFGSKGIVKVPVGESFSMKTELLDEYYQKAEKQGVKIIAVVGSAPSTSTGMYDNFEEIADFCKKKNLWFHVDGAHGGAAIYSGKYKYLVKGMEKADSVVIDGHKMLMTPALLTFLLFKNKNFSYNTFSQKAQYLLKNSDEEEWYNVAGRSFECTKKMMSINFYSILKIYGAEVFDDYVTTLYDIGKQFANKVLQRKNFELALFPHSNIVCYRYVYPGLNNQELNILNSKIRNHILKEGKFYIVQTSLNDITFMRNTFMNHRTTPQIMDELLDEIENIGINETNIDK